MTDTVTGRTPVGDIEVAADLLMEAVRGLKNRHLISGVMSMSAHLRELAVTVADGERIQGELDAARARIGELGR